ncbi:hypothetical protein Val02_67270 [Virgisporangium aliadipatigenens]|uniref:Thioesterase family protein n=1 Tax=Virgisporangium aliadipatigenens TaxID=741659 RepID=A0A8J4DU04_9ACTN|nr:thioesterase family protein [Virgisporangium aliadipatigenens]GIJ49841.1 hypothetical protein Val02_67270 [Virgisporangium aliadipatigenens]
MAGFVDATKVAPVADGEWSAELDGQWAVMGRPNGGYLAAVLARAAIASIDAAHPHPLATNAHYLNPPSPGPATIVTETLRRGRSVSQVRTRLIQDGTPCVEGVFTLGRLAPDAEPVWSVEAPPVLPPPQECRLMIPRPSPTVTVEILEVIEQRLDPAVLGHLRGAPDGGGEIRGYVGFVDGTDFDPLGLLFAADALPPASLTVGASGWVPTLEYTVYVRALPAPGPLKVRQRARLIQQPGWMVEECDVWDSADRLVAQAIQLASVRFS